MVLITANANFKLTDANEQLNNNFVFYSPKIQLKEAYIEAEASFACGLHIGLFYLYKRKRDT